MSGPLQLLDPQTFRDLGTFVGRARRLDPDGAARLVGHAMLLAVYVSPVHGGGGPTVLGLRTLALAEPSSLDVTVPLAALGDRLAATPAPAERAVPLPVPPMGASGAGWAGVSPPRSGWSPVGVVEAGLLRAAAGRGIGEVAATTPEGAGPAAVARLRALVWGAPIPGLDDVPAGVAFAAEGLGFLTSAADDEPVPLLRSGPWVRLTTATGHVLGRRPTLGS
jgi:hypothetical protein